MKIKMTILAFIIVATYAFAVTRTKHTPPSEFRDAVSDDAFNALKDKSGAEASGVNVPEPIIKPFYVETGSRKDLGNKGYMAANDSSAGVPFKPVEWVTINGGKFIMGTDSGEKDMEDTKPIHEVTIKTFQMSKTAVTVEQYAECVIKGGCTEPATGDDQCNWGKTGRQLHPVNCVDWKQANQYARFKGEGARLPSESEWEYAATSGGKNHKYPWGNGEPTCDRAVMSGYGGSGCGKNRTWPVCSRPHGNTGQGLCDMAGNVWQWLQDRYQDSYTGAPADGSAAPGAGFRRVLRGGSFVNIDGRVLRADNRNFSDHAYSSVNVGFRLAR